VDALRRTLESVGSARPQPMESNAS
jgi:hypothetical protein